MDAVVVDVLGPVVGAAVAWQAEWALRVTVVVSASFEIVPGGVMKPASPEPLSLPGDLAPYRPRADVLLAGHPVTQNTPVHLWVGRDHTLVDEVLVKVPGAFPAPAAAGARAARPITVYPPGFDWTALQAAPPEGRMGHLHGDEWIAIDGVRPARVQSRLPGSHALAAVYGHPAMPAGAPVSLAADTLRIDTDRMRAVLVWRGSFFVPNEQALASIRVMVGLDDAGRTARGADETAPAGTSALDAEAIARPAVPFVRGPSEPPPAAGAPGVRSDHTSHSTPVTTPHPPAPDRSPAGTAALDEIAQAFQRERPATPFQQASITPAAGAGSPAAPPAPPAPPTPAAPRAPAAIAPTGIRIDNDTGLALGVIPWGLSPSRDCLAVIVKATCDLVPGGPAEPRSRAAPLTGEIYAEDADGRYLAHPSDLVPFKVRADVVVIGHAVTPAGRVAEMDVELRFGHAESHLHRVIHVSGDREWVEGLAGLVPSPPEPFERLPIRHERAFGGPGSDENPAGVGLSPRGRRPRGPLRLPNLEDPRDRLRIPGRRPVPACFAPLPLAWRERSARPDRRKAPWPSLPEDLDWARFQAAPPSQRLPFLSGDEPFALSGMRAGRSPLQGTLPGLQPRCTALREGRREPEEVELRLDTVVLDVGSMTVHIVWRGALPVPDERQPDVQKVTLRAHRDRA